jgi:nicotinic acid mononucleotide adenylyltransferase
MAIDSAFTNFEKPLNLYYQGSFDPPHEGHRSALMAALEKTKAVAAIIVVDKGESLSKPNRSSWQHRFEMTKRTFIDFENVTVSQESKEEIKRELLKKVRLIALIGSDNFSLYSSRKSLVFDGICINLRDGESQDLFPPTLAGKPLYCSLPSIQHVSSTLIKEKIRTDYQVFSKTSSHIDAHSFHLTLQAIRYIIAHSLYSAYEIPITHTSSIFSKLSPHSIYSFTPIYPPGNHKEKLGGQSGSLFFKACNDTQQLFIKYFPKESHEIEYRYEIDGWAFIKKIGLTNSLVQDPAIHLSCKDFSFVSYHLLEKQDLAKSFLHLSSDEDRALFEQSCFFVGKALAELHLSFTEKKEACFFEKTLSFLLDRTIKRLEKMNEDQKQTFTKVFTASWENFLTNPGPCTFAHFDATPSNFIITKEKQILMIDLSSIGKSLQDIGLPIGVPAEDYYRFLGVLDWLNEDKKVVQSCMEAFKTAFKNGYEIANHLITPQAHVLFTNYWAIRNYKFLKEAPQMFL